MDAYSEFIEPTRVSHSIGCNLILASFKHLVVAKASLLQVFEPVKCKSGKFKLKLVQQFKLHGQVTDLKAIRTIENLSLDYLLVSTKAAKMSLVKWNHRYHSITTVSLHFYENAIKNTTFETLSRTYLTIEPNSNSCACMRFKNVLVFLPFVTSDDDSDIEDAAATDTKASVMSNNGGGHNSKSLGALETVELHYPSFMMDAQEIDPSIVDLIDLQFLYNYREPTLALLYVTSPTWAGNLPNVKDNVNFMLISLDIETRTPTPVLKVENLPYDVDRIVPLPLPFNGSLLFGANEIIHIDTGGISRRIAVNKYVASATNSVKSYLDQSDLDIKLENCTITPVPNESRLLMILENGEFYYIVFNIDGKSIKKISIEKLLPEYHKSLDFNYPGEVALLDNNLIFTSNKNGDNYLLEVTRDHGEDQSLLEVKPPQLNEIESKPVDNDKVDNDNDHDDDDDDLYEEEEVKESVNVKSGNITFIKHDTLKNHGPISSFTFGHYTLDKFKANLPNPGFGDVSIVAAKGLGNQGSLSIFTPNIQPIIKSSLGFSLIDRMWTISKKYLVTSDDVNQKSEIFQIQKSFARLDAKDFINNSRTVSLFELEDGMFSIQVTARKVIMYDSTFKKVASLKKSVMNLEADDEILYATQRDEFILLTSSTGEALIFSVNTYNFSFTKIDLPKILSDVIITTGYITTSKLLTAVEKDINILFNRGFKRKHSSASSKPSTTINNEDKTILKTTLFVLVTGDNRIVVFSRYHKEKCYQLNDLEKFTEHLTLNFFENKDSIPDPFIKQVVLNNLGKSSDKDLQEEYLNILTIGGQVIMYKMYFDGENYRFIRQKDLKITGAPENAYPAGTTIERRLVYLPNCSGYSGLFLTGVIPYWITKTEHAIPRIFPFSKIESVSFASYSDERIQNGFIFLDSKKNARIGEIPQDFNYDNKWPAKSVHIGETIKGIAFHRLTNTYSVSTYEELPYNCLDEEGNPIVGTDDTKTPATTYKGHIRLISPLSWTVIDSIDLEENEVGMSIKAMDLDVGIAHKRFKSKKEFIVVGTGKFRIEDLQSNGSFKIYEIIDIIPEPGKPETNHKFKEYFKEDTKGAATAICELSGRFLVSQGQKVIVRDLQDNGVVPVAFLDTSVYVTEAKSFGNMLILGDTLKSVWLAGFDAEPFRMILLGKDLQSIDVCCADFIVRDEELFILVADKNNVLHLLKFDPDDPSSLNGQRLLEKASFRINSTPTCLRSLPKHEEINKIEQDNFQCVGSTVDGSFFAVFPVSESTYMRMYVLQQQTIDKEYHFCGLNPRLNRFGDLPKVSNDSNLKPLLDCDVILGFPYLTEDRKRNFVMKVGANSYQDVWRDLIEFDNVLKNM